MRRQLPRNIGKSGAFEGSTRSGNINHFFHRDSPDPRVRPEDDDVASFEFNADHGWPARGKPSFVRHPRAPSRGSSAVSPCVVGISGTLTQHSLFPKTIEISDGYLDPRVKLDLGPRMTIVEVIPVPISSIMFAPLPPRKRWTDIAIGIKG